MDGISHCKQLSPGIIAFNGGASTNTSTQPLATAQDWELKVDLGKQLKFPENNNTDTRHGATFGSL